MAKSAACCGTEWEEKGREGEEKREREFHYNGKQKGMVMEKEERMRRGDGRGGEGDRRGSKRTEGSSEHEPGLGTGREPGSEQVEKGAEVATG